MTKQAAHTLVGYIEYLPSKTSFVTPVFTNKEGLLLIQFATEKTHSFDWEVLPTEYEAMVTKYTTSQPPTLNEPIYGFKWEEGVHFAEGDNMRNYLAQIYKRLDRVGTAVAISFIDDWQKQRPKEAYTKNEGVAPIQDLPVESEPDGFDEFWREGQAERFPEQKGEGTRGHMLREMADQELLLLYEKTDDTNMIWTLYERYNLLVFQRCLNLLKSPEKATDTTHDIFIELTKRNAGDQVANFRAWLVAFTHQYCLRQMRQERSKRVIELDPLNVGENVDIRQAVENRFVNEILDTTLLSEREKSVVALYYLEGRTIKEIAMGMQVSESSVLKALTSGRRKIQLHYQEQRNTNKRTTDK